MSKIIIIGGVAGGATTAARLRRVEERAEIILLEKGEYISYANCGLPYYIGEEITERENLLVMTPELMRERFRIDVRVQSEALHIDPEKKQVEIKNHRTKENYLESYDKLVIATGSTPVVPPIPGIHGKNIFQLWTVPDTDRIKSFIEKEKPKQAAVIGGGFIGLEMAENLRRQGIRVTVVEMADQCLAPLDPEMAELVHENLVRNQVELILKDGVKSFETVDNQQEITLQSGKKLQVDLVLLSIGVRPNSTLAKEAGLERNERGGIRVNEYLETSDADIYAVGDVIAVTDRVNKTETMIPLAGPANRQGRICADNLSASLQRENKGSSMQKQKEFTKVAYPGSLGTSIVRIFDLSAAATGMSEKKLLAEGKRKGVDFETVLINQKSHAGYYPGALMLTLKLVFDVKGRILGAQIVGGDGVDKRIDTIATVLGMGGSIQNLAELELAYAPPFSSAKDPVNMLGFTAQNLLQKKISFATVKELDTLFEQQDWKENHILLDVREDMEAYAYSIPGSTHIPLGKLRERIDELDAQKEIIVYCAMGVRSYNGARILMENQFRQVKVLEGGTYFYRALHTRAEAERTEKPESSATLESPVTPESPATLENAEQLNCSGMQCPGPIMRVAERMKTLEAGRILEVRATDMGFASDVKSWCKRTGNTYLDETKDGREYKIRLQAGANRGTPVKQGMQGTQGTQGTQGMLETQGKTMVVFSGDLDKVLASFIIANGAAAMGRPVTMFFTFWGLNALRKNQVQKVKKSVVERMFATMMPRGTDKLKLSKMNMGGMGTAMMKAVMKKKNVNSLEELMEQARKNGVRFVACTMSMDIMGITREELIDGVELAGVASYLGDAEESNVNLFI